MLNQRRVLLPRSMDPEGVRVLQRRPDVQVSIYDPALPTAELHALLAEAAGIALSWTPFSATEAAASPRLQVVARLGVGFDAVELPPLTARRIPLMTAGTANSTSVAEHAIHFIFALAKRAPELQRRVATGIGHDRKSALPGEVAGKTVLIVGFGRIGSRTAPRCKALEMRVLVHDPYIPADAVRAAGYEPAPDLDAALPAADFVTLHCPKSPETVGLFGAARLTRMKPGAFLVNTARGGIVDEAALLAALRSGHLAGAALDVFDPEPPDPANPLLHMENVLVSPHLAGVTTEAWTAISVVAAENILSVFDGAPIAAHTVNPEVLAA